MKEAIDAGDRDEFRAAARELKRRQRRLVRQIAEIREAMLKELLETNGIDYDEHWWKHGTDVNDINEFVFSAINKDVSKDAPSSKKK